MFCRNCGEPMNENQAICLKCGVAVGTGKSFCQNCGHAVNENATVCLNCGVALENKNGNTDDPLNGQDKVTMILICFFLGGFGIHNFMLGESKKGIAKIVATCFCGLGGILALIDFIRILTDKYVVDPNALF